MAEPQPIEIICVECGETIKVSDPVALIRALHLLHECSVSALLTGVNE